MSSKQHDRPNQRKSSRAQTTSDLLPRVEITDEVISRLLSLDNELLRETLQSAFKATLNGFFKQHEYGLVNLGTLSTSTDITDILIIRRQACEEILKAALHFDFSCPSPRVFYNSGWKVGLQFGLNVLGWLGNRTIDDTYIQLGDCKHWFVLLTMATKIDSESHWGEISCSWEERSPLSVTITVRNNFLRMLDEQCKGIAEAFWTGYLRGLATILLMLWFSAEGRTLQAGGPLTVVDTSASQLHRENEIRITLILGQVDSEVAPIHEMASLMARHYIAAQCKSSANIPDSIRPWGRMDAAVKDARGLIECALRWLLRHPDGKFPHGVKPTIAKAAEHLPLLAEWLCPIKAFWSDSRTHEPLHQPLQSPDLSALSFLVPDALSLALGLIHLSSVSIEERASLHDALIATPIAKRQSAKPYLREDTSH